MWCTFHILAFLNGVEGSCYFMVFPYDVVHHIWADQLLVGKATKVDTRFPGIQLSCKIKNKLDNTREQVCWNHHVIPCVFYCTHMCKGEDNTNFCSSGCLLTHALSMPKQANISYSSFWAALCFIPISHLYWKQLLQQVWAWYLEKGCLYCWSLTGVKSLNFY